MIKGLTKLHPDIPKEIASSYAAIGHPVMLGLFTILPITSLELTLAQVFLSDRHL